MAWSNRTVVSVSQDLAKGRFSVVVTFRNCFGSSIGSKISFSNVLLCSGCHLRQSQTKLFQHKKYFLASQRFYTAIRRCSSMSNGRNDNPSVPTSKPADIIREKKLNLPSLKPLSHSKYKPYYKPVVVDIDFNKKYYDNTFISATRAMSDYLLKPSDLENLRKTAVRSAYSDTEVSRDTFYLRSEVESRAFEVWGSPEALQREIESRNKVMEENERYRRGLSGLIGHLKKTVKDHTKTKEENQMFGGRKERTMMLRGSAKVVTYAILSNFSVMVFKFAAYLYTGSATMLSESIHSLADMLNQCLLAVGIMQSIKQPSPDHPYGWSRARYVYSLISGVGIFFLGAGVTVYHGISTLISPPPLENLLVAYTVLAGSFMVEGATLLLAILQVRKSAREADLSFWEYVVRGRDPSAVAVLAEDGAAVTGVMLAAACLGLTTHTGSPLFDAMGSIVIGSLLATTAGFLIHRNADFLIGRSIPHHRLQQIIEVVESDILVRSIHDVKATEMGADMVRFKAEVNFDGREITRCHINRMDMELVLAEIQKFTTTSELEQFLLEHGEQVIDVLGQQVDRIERNIKHKNPEVRHVDLEIL